MTELKTILQIEGPVSGVLPGQIACEDVADEDVGARMWGGKDHAGNVSKFLVKDGIAVVKKVVGEGGLTLESEHGSVDVTEAGESALATQAQSLVGAINELHRPVEVLYAELSPDGNSPASTAYALPAGWYICSFVKAEKISGDCSAVTVRLLDGLTEVYKHAGADGTGNDLDTEAMADRNVFSMENLSGNLTIEADSPAACVVRITLRVRAE